jgi:hypothetical protein
MPRGSGLRLKRVTEYEMNKFIENNCIIKCGDGFNEYRPDWSDGKLAEKFGVSRHTIRALIESVFEPFRRTGRAAGAAPHQLEEIYIRLRDLEAKIKTFELLLFGNKQDNTKPLSLDTILRRQRESAK